MFALHYLFEQNERPGSYPKIFKYTISPFGEKAEYDSTQFTGKEPSDDEFFRNDYSKTYLNNEDMKQPMKSFR